MYTIHEIQGLVESIACEAVPADGDIFTYGVTGDDFHEMMEKYASKFSVNMEGYLWYFHANEEGQNIGGLFYPPPYRLVKRIPITPETLLDFANRGRWELQYPAHPIPTKRKDILINQVMAIGLLIMVVVLALLRC